MAVRSGDGAPTTGASALWDEVYAERAPTSVSWYQRTPAVSLRLITSLASPESPVVDVGAGASLLVDELLALGFSDLTLVDVSRVALDDDARRLGPGAPVAFVHSDVLEWAPATRYEVWHDRALFHFLTDPRDQRRYVEVTERAVVRGGHVVLGCFGEDGPTQCSGLPVARHSAADLAAIFAPGYSLEASEREVHHTPSGAVQSFTWVTLRRE
ncbi:MAG: class I SAM-dependent methyltransferase [Acidobacteriota bacterium]|nr:class I SAM-dependent methyltransferase [Acidobacteriota bacterium]